MMTRLLGGFVFTSLVVLATACGDDSGNSGGRCGDGHVTGGENCDDGNAVSGDGCSSTCRSEGICGDNQLSANSEECDDGNIANGDGCSSTCDKEGTCGNGLVEPGETCDDSNTAAADGCNGVCMTEVGYTCTGEPSTCVPDGGGGSCAAPAMITLTAMGTDMVATVTGDTTTATNGLDEAACDGDVAGGGKDNIWKFTTSDVRDVLIVLTPDANFDGGIRMMTAPCDAAMEVIDQMGDDGCSDYDVGGGNEYLAYVDLPAGTYYVSVDGYTMTDEGPYELSITASEPTCGDGTVGLLEFCDDGNTTDADGCTHCRVDTNYNCDTSEPSVCQMEGCGDGLLQTGETCDDDNTTPSDGCDATCNTESNYTCQGEPSICVMQGCSNGFIENTEECDDGNMNNNDRCSDACLLEYDDAEAAEPNNTVAQALPAGSRIVRGVLVDDTDVDLYTFTLAMTSQVEIETYMTINGTDADYGGYGTNPLFDCLTTAEDTEIAIFAMGADPTDDNMALFTDDDDGDQYCSYLGLNDSDGDTTQLAMLAAGTYTIRVRPVDVTANALYILDLKIVPMGQAPVAPAAGDLKINEFLARDGGSTNGGVDSNCDGLLTNSDDEFIELVNVSSKILDLTGVTYSDALGVKFTFAPQANGSLTLDPGMAVVIWGGGAPACTGVTNFFVNGTAHTLSLNDAGDTITIATGGTSPVTIATHTYTGSSVTIGKSLNVSPDITGTAYVMHDTVTGAVGNYSPGKKVDGGAFP